MLLGCLDTLAKKKFQAASRGRDIRGRLATALDLFEQPEHVPVLPAFDQPSPRYANDRHAGDVEALARRRNAQSVTGMLRGAGPANAYLIALGDGIIHTHVQLGKRGLHAFEERIEF